MGLFSAPAAVDPMLSSVLIGGTPADLKKVGKAQNAILGALKPNERLIFVAASTGSVGGSSVWAFTDQRLLETFGKGLNYDLPLSKIANTTLKYRARGRDVDYWCYVYWRGGPLRGVEGNVNDNGFLVLERLNAEDEIDRVALLINTALAN